MNRRKFLSSSVIGLGAVSIIPTAIIANNNTISISSIGRGFNRISNQIKLISLAFLPQAVLAARERLIPILAKKEYNYSHSEIVKLSSNCYAIPLLKNSLIGFSSKAIALLIKHNGVFIHYILNEQTALAFSDLVENFSKGSDGHKLNLDTLAFVSPNRVIKESSGRESVFTYQNSSGNVITLKGSSKKQIAIIS